MVGELFRNLVLACKVQKIINENVSLKGGCKTVVSVGYL